MKKRIKVSLHRQVLFTYDGHEEVFRFDCATGDKDHPTNIGRFSIFMKDRKLFNWTPLHTTVDIVRI